MGYLLNTEVDDGDAALGRVLGRALLLLLGPTRLRGMDSGALALLTVLTLLSQFLDLPGLKHR